MQTIKNRVVALEAKANEGSTSLTLVLVEEGETPDQAMKRAGFASNAADMMCVMFISPEDASL